MCTVVSTQNYVINLKTVIYCYNFVLSDGNMKVLNMITTGSYQTGHTIYLVSVLRVIKMEVLMLVEDCCKCHPTLSSRGIEWFHSI